MEKIYEKKDFTEIISVKESQIHILELKNTLSWIKNLVNAFHNRLDTLEDWVSKLDNRLIENTQWSTMREKI